MNATKTPTNPNNKDKNANKGKDTNANKGKIQPSPSEVVAKEPKGKKDKTQQQQESESDGESSKESDHLPENDLEKVAVCNVATLNRLALEEDDMADTLNSFTKYLIDQKLDIGNETSINYTNTDQNVKAYRDWKREYDKNPTPGDASSYKEVAQRGSTKSVLKAHNQLLGTLNRSSYNLNDRPATETLLRMLNANAGVDYTTDQLAAIYKLISTHEMRQLINTTIIEVTRTGGPTAKALLAANDNKTLQMLISWRDDGWYNGKATLKEFVEFL